MGTYSALLRSPEQPVCCLCLREQGKEQVGVRHLGHVYFACELHKAHVRDVIVFKGSVSTMVELRQDSRVHTIHKLTRPSIQPSFDPSSAPPHPMSSGVTQAKVYAYEVALFGEFFARDLKAVLNRITLHTESAAPMHTREIVFEHLGTHLVQSQGEEPVLLRARKELGGGDVKESGWTLYSYLKPESVRVHPEATVRPWATCEVMGDALSLASALGYVQRSQIYKRGYVFRRGPLIIQMFQQEQVDPKTSLPIPAHADTLWEVEVKTASPFNTTAPQSGQVQVNTVRSAIEAVLEVQLVMKGLLDLRRQDI